MKNIKINKQQLITIVFIMICLGGYIYFPAKDDFQYKASFFIFLGVLPLLYNKYFLKKENFLKQLVIGDWKKNIGYLLIALIGSIVVMSLVFKLTSLGTHYFLPKNIKTNFIEFLKYEFGGIAFMVAVYEFFFRGFVMKYFLKSLGGWAILVQSLFFCVMILMLGGVPYWFYVVYLIFNPFAGWIAYKSKSIVYSFVGQWIFIVAIDATFVAITVHR